MALHDRFARPLRSLRVSVTDRCNLRCQYCMPEPDYVWLPREDILSFEEVGTLVDVFTGLGVDRLRITGGEPLLRRGLPGLIERLAARPAVRDLALTTNGILLARQAASLRRAGLHRITVSLDTLVPERFLTLTRFDAHAEVLEGLDAAAAAGFDSVKIDTVVIRGVNDDELSGLLEHGRKIGAEVRFIEYMDVGGATHWTEDAVVSRAEILSILESHYGPITPIEELSSAPADRFRLADGTPFGIISSTTAPFCASCDRSRLTADGVWLLCLYAQAGTDLRRPLRAGATRDELMHLITAVWEQRADRGAEERLHSQRREHLIPVAALRKNAHLEMHTRGG
jgi:cyclic pyranopterin phosphate synthase